MHENRTVLLAGILIAASTATGHVDARQKPERFRTSTAAVVVDVVVRNGKGEPVPGLTADDFSVYEDGVRQTITSFDAIADASTSTLPQSHSSAAQSGPGPRNERVPATVALVFEQLSPEGRRLSEKAATAFVNNTLTSSDYAAVFSIDRTLLPIVRYTHDLDALRKGVRVAARRPGYALEHAGQVPGAEYGSYTPGQPSQSTQDDRADLRGRATFDALEALIDSMQAGDGRKAVVLFSEGLTLMPPEDLSADGMPSPNIDSWLSDGRYEHFLRVFERANRAHVAFYTFDAKGLRIEGLNDRHCFGCAPYVGLQMLADQTGGTFVDSTNDLVGPVQRVGADLRTYYLLGYASTNSKADDKYRQITVKVEGKDLHVLARKGYVASATNRK